MRLHPAPTLYLFIFPRYSGTNEHPKIAPMDHAWQCAESVGYLRPIRSAIPTSQFNVLNHLQKGMAASWLAIALAEDHRSQVRRREWIDSWH
jgi:hypothetical protein